MRGTRVRSLGEPNSYKKKIKKNTKPPPVRAPVGGAEIRDGSDDSQESMEIDQSSSTRLKGAFGGEQGFFDNRSEHESERGLAWAAASVGVGLRQTRRDGCN